MSQWLAAAGPVVAVLAVVVAYLGYRVQVRAFHAKAAAEREEQRLRDRTTDTAAHTAAQTALASSAQQLAQASYALVDRLQADIDRIRKQAEAEALAARRTIEDLQQQVAVAREEIEALRRGP